MGSAGEATSSGPAGEAVIAELLGSRPIESMTMLPRMVATPMLRHVQVSKRSNRSLHAREVTVKLATGRAILWDLDNGIDKVIRSDLRRIVGCFPFSGSTETR